MIAKNSLTEIYQLFSDTPARTLQFLLLHVLKIEDISEIIKHDIIINDPQKKNLERCIHEYKKGKPLEYIIGKCDFFAMEFFVNKNVLIPRIETEILVEIAIKEIGNKKCTALDLCTGSGAIAVSVAKHCPNVDVVVIDICDKALGVCRQNIEKHNLQTRVNIVQMDILNETLPSEFHYVFANPPYIESNNIEGLDNSVKHFEPHLALDGGVDGLKFYKQIYKYALSLKNSVFLMEIGFNQAQSVHKIFSEFCPQIIKDYNKNDRIIKFTS